MKTKKHRLPEAAYHGRRMISFTACEARRKPLLANPEVAPQLLEQLATQTLFQGCTVPVYCLMPDHLHVVIAGQTEISRPKLAMDRFKQTSGAWFKFHRPDLEWQDDFHDHIIRTTSDWHRHVRYIALNPVRAKLVEDGADWPYTGAIGCDIKEIIEDAFW